MWSEAAINYFAERAIAPDLAAELGVLEDGHGLLFPYRGEGETFSRRRSLNGAGPKVSQPKGTRLCPWQPVPGEELRDVLVTEGESDALAALSALRDSPVEDLRNLPVVAIPGTGFPVERVVQHLTDGKCRLAWIALDADDAGRAYMEKLVPELIAAGAKVCTVELAEGRDLADCLAAQAEDQRADWIANMLLDTQAGGEETVEVPGAPVDTAELLDEVKRFIGRFVVLPSEAAADLLALWVLHTHAIGGFWATPYLRVTSAAPDSGKTLLLEILAVICRRGWHAVNPSSAVLYRKVDRDTPTLLLDEMDNFPLDDRRDALSILNTGYKRGATVDRCKENGELQSFAAYCPKAYAGLDVRSIVPALLSRSITIRMEKKISTEKVDMWIAPLVEPGAIRLRGRCEAWGDQHTEALTDHTPDLVGLINRAAEVWWALLAIAEHAGDGWHARAKGAVAELATGGDETDTASDPVLLLLDIRDAIGSEQTIFTKDLLAKLNALDESPWGARRKGEGLDARGLARMLRPFQIKSRTVRVGSETAKGYHVDQFEDAFARHLSEGPQASQGSQGSQPAPHLERDVTDVTDVTDKSTPASVPQEAEEGLGCAVHPTPAKGCRYCTRVAA